MSATLSPEQMTQITQAVGQMLQQQVPAATMMPQAMPSPWGAMGAMGMMPASAMSAPAGAGQPTGVALRIEIPLGPDGSNVGAYLLFGAEAAASPQAMAAVAMQWAQMGLVRVNQPRFNGGGGGGWQRGGYGGGGGYREGGYRNGYGGGGYRGGYNGGGGYGRGGGW